MKCRKGHVGSSMIQDNNLGRSASIANISEQKEKMLTFP